MSLRGLIRSIAAALWLVLAVAVVIPSGAWAQDVALTPDGMPVGTPAGQIPPTTPSSNSGATYQPGEITSGNSQAAAKINSLFSSVITAAATTSQLVKAEADKLAGGLAVITIVLAAARFAATKDPVNAWVVVFEELGTLGIFASIYLAYVTFAPGFYNWFGTLATDISGSDMSGTTTSLFTASGQLYDAFAKSFDGASWYEYPKLLMAVGPLLIAWVVLGITAIVFTFFVNIGQLQAAVGIVMGQIALALGFSSFTRGYFKSWLDYMVSAGMYTVVAAILMKLVSASLTAAIDQGRTIGLSTPQGATYVMDLSIFIFLVSFEIPKMAGMFGGGANASGSLVGKVARVATGGLV
ncbi:type IV secretion system protein [Paraburkholderia sp. BL10I2N1]|uniref:type IV secretion system protein n=1 Tax=Paraburkholderia sp. BL10I2N1 TaxID=1938796 RepID=UPI00105F84B5|nr:type IV secretion system protein [Paraburkholderia sp. BL10I2N1]TDN59029.1 TrbL/VirB6 plasmid conjugal transfer protein [Paraburkholderia sp. BL10I2N1]